MKGVKAFTQSLLQVAVSERAVCTYFLSYSNILDFFPLHILQIFFVLVLFCLSQRFLQGTAELLPPASETSAFQQWMKGTHWWV